MNDIFMIFSTFFTFTFDNPKIEEIQVCLNTYGIGGKVQMNFNDSEKFGKGDEKHFVRLFLADNR